LRISKASKTSPLCISGAIYVCDIDTFENVYTYVAPCYCLRGERKREIERKRKRRREGGRVTGERERGVDEGGGGGEKINTNPPQTSAYVKTFFQSNIKY